MSQMKRRIRIALDMALEATQGRLHRTTNGCPCVLYEHGGITYSFVFIDKYQRFKVFSHFGAGDEQESIKNIKPTSLFYVVDRIQRGVFR